MGDKTGIQWTDATWNPVRGCSRVSPGCENCYAERQAIRMSGPGGAYEGLVRESKTGPRWTGKVRLVPELLDQPLRWTKPRRVFVNSMSDLFHDALTDGEIDQALAVMLLAPHHTFQVLTKRSARMRGYFSNPSLYDRVLGNADALRRTRPELCGVAISNPTKFPASWIWLGVSAEDQQRADERIPDLLATPAAVRFVSYEPALGPVDFARFMWPVCSQWPAGFRSPEEALAAGAQVTRHRQELVSARARFLDWIIVGGESGPHARPCDVAWIRSVLRQCKDAGVACFVKQLGAHVIDHEWWSDECGAPVPEDRRRTFAHAKGADPSEWPEDVRVREFPEVKR